MKKALLISISIFYHLSLAHAQETGYEVAMQKNVSTLDTASHPSTYQTLVNSFERIALAEGDQWLPFYYAGYCATKLTYLENDVNFIDKKADKAEEFASAADALSPENTEIYCLKAMNAFSRINVDFMTRGPKFSGLANEYLLLAQKYDPTNPRAYLMLGQSKYTTPEQFGGDKELGCKLIHKAYELYTTNEISNKIDPHWGQVDAKKIVENECHSSKVSMN